MMYGPDLARLLVEEHQRAIARAASTRATIARSRRDAPRKMPDLPRPPFYYRGIAASVWRAALRRTSGPARPATPAPDRGLSPVRLCS